jgi:polyisoprenyl-phosphate glycosyltransferase
MKLISIVSPCYNEEENINSSTDKTVSIIRELAEKDRNIKLIINSRNFGHIRSPFYGLLQAKGDAVILLVSDLQDPPTLIPEFIQKWEENYKIVVGVKNQSHESALMFAIRKWGYRLISKISNIKLIKNFTGFGLYDQSVIEILRQIDDPYPYFRGLISEIGFETAEISFTQPARKRGITKNNFYTLYDIGMLGITSYSKLPIRLAAMAGFGLSILSFLMAIIFIVLKIIFWESFSLGVAPILIGIFFFSSVQLFFIGLLGEYIGAIHTQVLKRPLVIEKERINFDE